jgi:hypothetical protein
LRPDPRLDAHLRSITRPNDALLRNAALPRRLPRRRRSFLSVAVGFLLASALFLGCLALGVWADISWLLVPGIVEIVHGAQRHPASSGLIAWGVIKIVLAVAVSVIAFYGGLILAALTWAFFDE